MELAGRVAIITGASSGIGLASARSFVAAGARVALAARSAEKLEALAAELGGPSSALAVPLDLRGAEAAGALVEQAEHHFGRVDILVNNAGVGHYGPLVEAPWGEIEQVLETNLLAPIHLVRAVVPAMRRLGGGTIINVGSVVGRRALPNMAAYSVSKFGLHALGEALRVELAGLPIQVVTLLPGATRTAFNRSLLGAPPRGGRKGGPLSVTPERVADRIVELARNPRPIAYVALHDRLWVWLALLAPRLVDRLLWTNMRREGIDSDHTL